MIFSHIILGFITSYIGYVPPSMLNITAGKISLESDKKVARQFIIGASLIVLVQFFLAVALLSLLNEYPNIIVIIKKLAIVIFLIISIVFIRKFFLKTEEKNVRIIKNGFLFGLSLSSINMFAIPFFAVAHSSFVMHNWISATLVCTSYFGVGTVLGTFVILNNYVFLARKFKSKITLYTKYFNLLIGIITGFVAIFSIIKLYF